jgi:Family of unknown function (DUF6194)
MTDFDRLAPDHDAVVRAITEAFPEADIVTAMGATFFSLDPEKHWPNFATIVTTDEHDMGSPSNLSARPEVFRLNIGVSRQTFEDLVGSQADPDYAALDRLLLHPVYAQQHWISILNPSTETFEMVVKPLLVEAHDRIARTRAKHEAAS